MKDKATAEAFATSWNNLPAGSVYTREQFEDWMAPLTQPMVQGKEVLELGCGNGSLLLHMVSWSPRVVTGVDLGSSVQSARSNLERSGYANWRIEQADLTAYSDHPSDLVYCIGVLHHLADPRAGFESVVRNTADGGMFHCWVYAHEGNAIVRWLVEPLRKIACRLPWWLTKFGMATPLAVPFFLYAKTLAIFESPSVVDRMPLAAYCRWIAQREFAFFRHVAFDQLVTPQTHYIRRSTIEAWLRENPRIEPGSTYVLLRNGNSWKFGGRTRAAMDGGKSGEPPVG